MILAVKNGMNLRFYRNEKQASDELNKQRRALVRQIPVEESYPPIDVVERGNELLVVADLPGVEESSIRVEYKGGMLILKGLRKSITSGGKLVYGERRAGSFERLIPVGQAVDPEGVRVRFRKGVLTVRLPLVRKGQVNCN